MGGGWSDRPGKGRWLAVAGDCSVKTWAAVWCQSRGPWVLNDSYSRLCEPASQEQVMFADQMECVTQGLSGTCLRRANPRKG